MRLEQPDPLAQRLRQHCPEAWSAFYRDHVRQVWRLAYRRLGQSHAADEVASQTFLAAVESIDRCDPHAGAPRRWLFGIARRKIAEHLRHHYRRRGRYSDRPVEDLEVPALVETDDGQEARDRVRTALATLPASHRDVLLWLYQDRLSVRDIAERLNRTEKAAENMLYRARQRFGQAYGRVLESESAGSSK